ncbi:MAG: hypothetical protein HY809_07770 [Nitrospirae bacterium]|nr:hypothetical protein [Nitrospirota bacterium]
MIRTVSALILILLSGCATQRQYTFEKFLKLEKFEAQVIEVTDLPSPPTFLTDISGADRRILLKTLEGRSIMIDKVPTSIGGNFCGTVDLWLPVKEGERYTFPDALQPKQDCTNIFSE